MYPDRARDVVDHCARIARASSGSRYETLARLCYEQARTVAHHEQRESRDEYLAALEALSTQATVVEMLVEDDGDEALVEIWGDVAADVDRRLDVAAETQLSRVQRRWRPRRR